MSNSKTQFQRDWLEANWDKFVNEGIEDSHGRLIMVADAMADISGDGHRAINAAFSLGSGFLWCTVERIAKAYLLEVVVSELWNNYLAELEDGQKQD